MRRALVLIVENESLIAETIRQQLVRMNHEVLGIADSGEEAMRLAKALSPDLVLMDGALHGSWDGFEVGHRIESLLGCLIIYVTADPRAFEMPYSVLKPFTMARLAAVVTQALATRSGNSIGASLDR